MATTTRTASLQETQAPKLYAIFSIFFALPLIAVALRLVARRASNLRLWWDDWLILVATVALNNGGGRHVQAIANPARLEKFQIYTYANEIVYALMVVCVQSSILCLYLRIFGINRSFARTVHVALALVLAWGVATLATSVFQCRPVAAAWDKGVLIPGSGHCIDLRTWLIGTNVPHIVIDFSILLLPLPQIWRLKLSTGRKISLSGVFLVGAFTSAVSIIRVNANASIAIDDPTWDYVAVMIWSTIEGNVGVVCACLPTLGALVNHPLPRGPSSSSSSSSPAYALSHPERAARMPHRSLEFNRLDEDVAGLVPKRAVLVESDIFVERENGDQA
ncbi:MAG: hypothetical protein ASARMPRED_008516, partial [Alectoria sarmentosa]